MGLAGSHTMEVQKGIIEAIGNTPLLKLWRVSETTVSVCGTKRISQSTQLISDFEGIAGIRTRLLCPHKRTLFQQLSMSALAACVRLARAFSRVGLRRICD
jgi:hypothetical protein